jgi:type VI secretion system protein ImpI
MPYQDLWSGSEDAAPPVDRAALRAPREQPAALRPDFLDWAADVPDVFAEPAPRARREAPPNIQPDPNDDLSWARGAPKPVPAPEPAPPVPTPRRPVYVTREPEGPWASPTVPAAPAEGAGAPSGGEAAAPRTPPVEAPLRQSRADFSAAPPAASDFARLVAHGAGVPDELFARRSPEELAEQLGLLMKLVTDNVRQLLSARLEAKRLAGSSNQTMIQALDNNPLKFSPTSEDALRIMFGPPTASYLDARRAFEQSFADLKKHQMKTFAAMQQALAMLVEDLDPRAIESKTEPEKGISGLVTSRKARLWDTYLARWEAKTHHREGGLIDVFMDYFIECYDRGDSVR